MKMIKDAYKDFVSAVHSINTAMAHIYLNILNLNMRKGFTLIELVIVIAIIAILAVGVIAALNPLEQNNRAKDGKYKNTLGELMSAIQRWNTVSGYMPFCVSAVGACQASTGLMSTITDTAGGTTIINKLVNLSEITTNFTSAVGTDLASIWATYNSANKTVSLCYQPLSQAAKADGTKSSTGLGAGTYYCITQ